MSSIDLGSLYPFTRRQLYTPTFDAGLTGSMTSTFYYWREGQHVNIDGVIAINGTTGGAAEDLFVSIPSGLTIDTAVLPGGASTTTQLGTNLGTGFWFNQGNAIFFIYPIYATTTTLKFWMNVQRLSPNQLGNGDGVHMRIKAPIVGW